MKKHILLEFLLLTILVGLAGTAGAAVVTYTYDPSLGTLPDAQGWTENNDPGATVNLSGGVLSVQSTLAGLQSWSRTLSPFLYTDQVVIEATMRINSSSHITFPAVRSGYYLGIQDNTTYPAWTAIADTGVQFLYDGENTSSFVPVTLNDGQFHDFRMVADSTGFDLFIDNVQYIDEPFSTGFAGAPNTVYFGDQSTSGISNVDLSFYQITIGQTVPLPATGWLFGSGLIGLIGMAKRKKA